MTKFLTKLAIRAACFAAFVTFTLNVNAQIPNWDFENWTTIVNDIPTPWVTFGKTTKVSPGASGLYALKMQGDEQRGPGAAIHGNPGGNKNEFLGGAPFTARPDSVVAYFKYDITPGDSAWVLVFLKKNGVYISSDLYEFTGSNPNSFERKAFKIHYISGVNPDTIFIGFTSTLPEGNTTNTVSWVILDNISFTGTTQNVPNPDFETWTTQTIYTPFGWEYENRPGYSAVDRSTDKYGGYYALKLSTTFTPEGDTIQGQTQTSRLNNKWNWGPAFAVTGKPTSLKGYYKYIPQNGDTFRININMFKNGQEVGGAEFMTSANVNTYSQFSADINYWNLPSGNPDSATISISTFSSNYNGSMPRGQSVAYVDNLSFDKFINAGIPAATTQISNISVYPNPAVQNLNVKFYLLNKETVKISLYDLYGCEVLKLSEQNLEAGNHELNFSMYPLTAGIYYVVTQSGTSVSHSKLMITK